MPGAPNIVVHQILHDYATVRAGYALTTMTASTLAELETSAVPFHPWLWRWPVLS